MPTVAYVDVNHICRALFKTPLAFLYDASPLIQTKLFTTGCRFGFIDDGLREATHPTHFT